MLPLQITTSVTSRNASINYISLMIFSPSSHATFPRCTAWSRCSSVIAENVRPRTNLAKNCTETLYGTRHFDIHRKHVAEVFVCAIQYWISNRQSNGHKSRKVSFSFFYTYGTYRSKIFTYILYRQHTLHNKKFA